jgi:hypothetical protein
VEHILGRIAVAEINIVRLLRTPKLLECKFILTACAKENQTLLCSISLHSEHVETLLYSLDTDYKVAVSYITPLHQY